MATDSSNARPAVERLQREIRHMRIEFERFFNGDLEIPPTDLTDKIRAQINRLREGRKTYAENFQLNGLEARFHAYTELFQRRLREREVHGGKRPPRPVAAREADPANGIIFGDRVDRASIKPLYERLYGDGRRNPVDPDTFADYLLRQHRLIRDRSGCRQVRFRVVEVDGKPTLKARPEKG